MPVCNAEKHLAQAVESVLAQSHADLRLLVVENGSRDRSPAILADYARRDRRVSVHAFPERLGVGGAGQAAIELAETEWVLRLDADDVMLPDCIDVQLEVLRRLPGVRAIIGRAEHITGRGGTLGLSTNPAMTPAECRQRTLTGELLASIHSGTLLHRPTVIAVGGYRSKFSVLGEDTDLLARLVEAGHDVTSHERPIVQYRLHSGSVTAAAGQRRFLHAEWVSACLKARLSHQIEPTFDNCLDAWRQLPWLERIRRRRGWTAATLYRQAATLRGEGSWLDAGLRLVLATLLDPAGLLPRVQRNMSLIGLRRPHHEDGRAVSGDEWH
ncbi:MAG: glycosyltransferase family 2 protein [Candidatus Wallbacteria bacterium]|nr:glycosyltransferase family 2 protein [Candidatus Wallbacteria bacterium]